MNRILFINAFRLRSNAHFRLRPAALSENKADNLLNFNDYAHLLNDVQWDLDTGAFTTHGDWPVTTHEEFMSVGLNRLALVRKACQSGNYQGIVLLGGGDPGFVEAVEIASDFGVPVVSCAWAQMHLARLVSDKFALVDISDAHVVRMKRLAHEYGFSANLILTEPLGFPLAHPPNFDQPRIDVQRDEVFKTGRSVMLDRAIEMSLAALKQKGAGSIILGCSAAFWLRPFLEKALRKEGIGAPVFEGYSASILQLKTLMSANCLVDFGQPGH